MSSEKIAVVGLGYVGLPFAVQAAQRGYKVLGVDTNVRLVEQINNRLSPYDNDHRFNNAFRSLSHQVLSATTSFDGLDAVESVVICVPTPTRNNVPDLGLVRGATQQVADHLHEGQLVSLESTVNHGVTRGVVLPLLQKKKDKYRVGKDFNLAHCPERIDPGNPHLHVGNINRVVGGVTDDCTMRATNFYRSIIDAEISPLGSCEEAEFVKSWENSIRNVYISLANLAAQICDTSDMDIKRVHKGLQSKIDQFGLGLAMPGIGPGGHCIPEDIHFVIQEARRRGVDTSILEEAAALNDSMPKYAVHRLRNTMKEKGYELENCNVALLGLAYKPNIADMRRSPAIEVGYELLRYARSISVHDPEIPEAHQYIKGAKQAHTVAEAIKNSEAIVIATAHDQYVQEISPQMLENTNVRFILDGRNCLNRTSFIDSKLTYIGIGC